MKKLLLMLVIAFATAKSFAQTEAPKIETPPVTREITVVDSTGLPYSTEYWNKAVKSGKYKLERRYEMGQKPVFLLKERTEDEIDAQLAKAPRPRLSTCFKDGDTFKYSNLTDIKGKKIAAKDLVGKILVINFWFVSCPPCRQEIPELNDLVKKFSNEKDVIFVAIALDQAESVENFLKLFPFNYSQVPDGRYYADKFRVTQYPTHVIIDRTAKVSFHSVGGGAVNTYWLKKTIKSLL
ncbi:TlpA family protein disulfide reductase [Pedobacter glucosidilyticus]|uniref:TlpA family protein disulfide reductase n=1 Tax=Pedobacter glucosidilyticus TaxID=1122941 RepID=UPI0026E965DA|nr:TlpA disulfide reductase family protein [Pedobacter glucosidilyticus]